MLWESLQFVEYLVYYINLKKSQFWCSYCQLWVCKQITGLVLNSLSGSPMKGQWLLTVTAMELELSRSTLFPLFEALQAREFNSSKQSTGLPYTYAWIWLLIAANIQFSNNVFSSGYFRCSYSSINNQEYYNCPVSYTTKRHNENQSSNCSFVIIKNPF